MKRPQLALIVSAMLLLPLYCAIAAGPTPTAGSTVGAAAASIGVAWMEKDGTIVLRLVARGAGGVTGEGLLRYPPSHPQYREILDHVGPLRPGESRPVAPWPD